MQVSALIRFWLGRWHVCGALFVLASAIAAFVAAPAARSVLAYAEEPSRLLDQCFPTWSRTDALKLLSGIGGNGRRALLRFYLGVDFWFPMCSIALFYASLLSLAFPGAKPFAWLNVTPGVMWLSDVAENVNHYTMAKRFPRIPNWSLHYGPWFTLSKYFLLLILPMLALAGFLYQLWATHHA